MHLLPEGVADEAALHARRHPAHVLRGRRAQRRRPPGRHRGDRRGGADRAGGGADGAGLFSPLQIVVVDPVESRRAAARAFGADLVAVARTTTSRRRSGTLTGGLGADVAIEAVGLPATFDLAVAVIRPGGRVANVGVHGKPTTLHLEELWIKDVTITTGLVDTVSTPTLLSHAAGSGRLDPAGMVTHRFGFDAGAEAYDVFEDPETSGALKVAVLRG